MSSFEEKLIEAVRGYEHLYNIGEKTYHDQSMKENAWMEIATTMNVTVTECKKKWNAIRDNYRKAMRKRKTKSGQEVNQTKPYKYQEILSFLAPFITERDQQSNIILLEENTEVEERHEAEDNTVEDQMMPAEASVSANPENVKETDSSPNIIGRKTRPPHISTVLQIYFQKKGDNRREKPKDHLNKFFEAMEETVRTFNPVMQIEVKYKLSSIIMDYELMNLSQTANAVSSADRSEPAVIRRTEQPNKKSFRNSQTVTNYERGGASSFAAHHSHTPKNLNSQTVLRNHRSYEENEMDDGLNDDIEECTSDTPLYDSEFDYHEYTQL